MTDQEAHQHETSGNSLENCPACMYDLRGLTPPMNCPECGFAVTANILVYKPSGRIRIESIPFQVMGLIPAWHFWQSSARSRFPAWFSMYYLVLSTLMAFGFFAFCVRRLRHSYPYEYLVLTPDKLHIRVRGYADVSIDWGSVSRISVSRFFERVLIYKVGKKRPIGIPRFFWPKRMPLAEFAALFEAAHRDANLMEP